MYHSGAARANDAITRRTGVSSSSVRPSVRLSGCLSGCLAVWLSGCLDVCLASRSAYTWKRLFRESAEIFGGKIWREAQDLAGDSFKKMTEQEDDHKSKIQAKHEEAQEAQIIGKMAQSKQDAEFLRNQ